MTIHLSAEVGSDTVSTDGEELTCQTTIRTDVDKIDSDLPKHLALCIDSSNSMEGRKIKHAREGIKRAVDVLDDHDFVSIVEFSGSVSRVLDPTQCGPNRQRIKREVDSISTTGGTNIIAGMKEAKSALKEKSGSGLLNTVLSNDEEFIEWIVLVSDGNPTTVPDLISTLMPHKDKTDRHISVAEEFADDGLRSNQSALELTTTRKSCGALPRRLAARWNTSQSPQRYEPSLRVSLERRMILSG